MSSDQWVIRTHGVHKSYGPVEVLSGVDVSIEAGETVAIMGPSGSGKTTLLYALSSILTPEAGSVILRAKDSDQYIDIAQLDHDERSTLRLERFGFVFQQGLLLPELTASENVQLPLLMTGTPRVQAIHLAHEMLMRLGLAGLDNRRIGQLSGGQAQRVAIARALILSPQVVFADEPTGALDSQAAQEVLDRLLSMSKHTGNAVVLVTHDQGIASGCDRILRLLDGNIVKEQRP